MYFPQELKKFNLPTWLWHCSAPLYHRHWVHPHLLHHPLAAATVKDKGRLQYIHQEGDWLQSAISPGPVCLQDSEANRKDYGRPLQPRTEALLSGKRLQSIKIQTSHHMYSFLPSAVGLINKAWDPYWHWLSPHPRDTTHHINIKSPYLTWCITLAQNYIAHILIFFIL